MGQIKGTIGICEFCGASFVQVGRKRFCSQKCQHKSWEKHNAEHVKETHRAKNNKYYQNNRKKITEYKLQRGCAMCGYRKAASALDFHHIIPENKASGIKYNKNNTEEMTKCIILCANCHREIHDLMRTKQDQTIAMLQKYKQYPVQIGEGTIIWKFTNILPGAVVGKNCIIGAYTEIGLDVKIGDGCKIENGVFIPKGVEIGNEVFLGPRCVFTNDRYPRCADYGKFEKTIVEDNVNIGAGTTLRCGITLGEGCTIGAGSMVTHNIPAGETWCGNPARRLR